MRRNYNRGLFKHIEELQERIDSLCLEVLQLKECRRELEDENQALKAENAELKVEIRRLVDDNTRLKRILNNNSKNSSLPPSTDQKPSKPVSKFNSRTPTGRKPGAQPGHDGTTLTREKVQALINSGQCIHEISDIGGPSNDYITRFVVDLQVKPLIHEIRIHPDEHGEYHIAEKHRSVVVYGDNVRAFCLMLYAHGHVPALRSCQILSEMTSGLVNLSEGTFHGICQQFSTRSMSSIEDIKTELLNAEVLYTDATNVTVNGRQEYIRNQSTKGAVLYSPMKTKSIPELEKTGIIGEFAGIMVHDHETALYHFGTDHAECGAHLMRYLKKNFEETGHVWNTEMSEHLSMCNQRHKEFVENEGIALGSTPAIKECEERFDQILAEGRKKNDALPEGDTKNRDRSLLHRLAKYKDNHLLFLHRTDVDFTNNLSERDLRKCKNRQKISGGFRNQTGKSCYCVILSITETAKRKAVPFIRAVRDIMVGKRIFALN